VDIRAALKMFLKDEVMMMLLKMLRPALAFVALVVFAISAQAQLKGINQDGRIDPVPVAIAPFLSSGADEAAATITGVIANNLGRSGYFAPISPDNYPEQISSLDVEPAYDAWRGIKARALVAGTVVNEGSKIRVSFKLYDINSGKMIASQSLAASPKLARRLAHRVSDQIYQELTGFEGYFDTRVVYIDETGSKEKRIKKLAIMDQDGFNPRTLPDTAFFANNQRGHFHVIRHGRAARICLQYRHQPKRNRRGFSDHEFCTTLFTGRQPHHHVVAK
jgi:Tol biopolymer transport system component